VNDICRKEFLDQLNVANILPLIGVHDENHGAITGRKKCSIGQGKHYEVYGELDTINDLCNIIAGLM